MGFGEMDFGEKSGYPLKINKLMIGGYAIAYTNETNKFVATDPLLPKVNKPREFKEFLSYILGETEKKSPEFRTTFNYKNRFEPKPTLN
uniref:Uncharacterized protein n=1 Tax=Rhizophagus irregularis (strain DAOM 181602 / DAOM 197198 / MUCL 43194) TaxID=747089 RepID=U9TRP9_RHIID